MIVSPVRIVPGTTTLRVSPAQLVLATGLRVRPAQRVLAEPGPELGASPMRGVGHLEHGIADLKSRAAGQVGQTEIEVDIELIAGKGPTAAIARHQVDGAAVGERDLLVGMRRAVGRARRGLA